MALDINKIQKPMRKIGKLLNKISNPPTPDEVHDLRTSARKLEASVQALSLDSRGNERRVLKHVGRLRKRAGKVRDMDVLISYASTVHANGIESRRSTRRTLQSSLRFPLSVAFHEHARTYTY
jgi:CHAD domain-containing protein